MQAENIEIDEFKFSSRRVVKEDQIALILENPSKQIIESSKLSKKLRKIKNIENIEALEISPSSLVEDLTFAKSLPNLKRFFIYGFKILSFNGLSEFDEIEFLQVNTGKNKKRRISEISESNLKSLDLRWNRTEDIRDISNNSTIRQVIFVNYGNYGREVSGYSRNYGRSQN